MRYESFPITLNQCSTELGKFRWRYNFSFVEVAAVFFIFYNETFLDIIRVNEFEFRHFTTSTLYAVPVLLDLLYQVNHHWTFQDHHESKLTLFHT